MDCGAYLVNKYGEEWCKEPHKKDGKLTELGRDQLAITNMIWHTTNTNWFEYKSGTRLHHLRFPLRYRKIARDGVPIYLESDGPTSMDDQPLINDKVKRARIREKVEKVLDRRYMLRTGLNIKSLI